MARLRAVVTIHAPGFGGSPSDGHLAAATVKASWTASSAASISPRKRIRVATQRPYSRRKTASILTAHRPMTAARIRSVRVGRVSLDRVAEIPIEQWADLDRPLFRDRGELGPLQGLVQRVDVGPHLPALFRGHGNGIVAVEREQALRHNDHSRCHPAGFWPALTPATK